MSIDYGLLSLFVGFAYALLVKYVPDFPITQELVLTLLIWALVKFGVEITNKPVRALLAKAQAAFYKAFPSLVAKKPSKKSK